MGLSVRILSGHRQGWYRRGNGIIGKWEPNVPGRPIWKRSLREEDRTLMPT